MLPRRSSILIRISRASKLISSWHRGSGTIHRENGSTIVIDWTISQQIQSHWQKIASRHNRNHSRRVSLALANSWALQRQCRLTKRELITQSILVDTLLENDRRVACRFHDSRKEELNWIEKERGIITIITKLNDRRYSTRWKWRWVLVGL